MVFGKIPTLEVSPIVRVACGLKFHWYLRTLSLKGVFSKPSGKMIVVPNFCFCNLPKIQRENPCKSGFQKVWKILLLNLRSSNTPTSVAFTIP